nr:tyrosine-type recombinase/integrase [Anaerolineae bacterium]
IKPDNISQIVRRICHAAAIRGQGSHALRHRNGHQMADQGVAPSVAARVLGHSDVMVTLKHYYPKDWKRAEKTMKDLAYKPKTIRRK